MARGVYERVGKRALDVTVSVPAVVVAAPIMGLIALAIWLEDRGPALFRQQRVGAHGTPFTVLKFRSMPVGTPERESADAADLQVTRVGRAIRRISFDELPQLINVVRGDMSLVGPRPALASQDDVLALRAASGADRLRPGLTGLAQVNAFDGMSPEEKAEQDAEYATRVTLRTDLEVAFATLGYLTRKPPEY